jgi:hypothetical protein
MRGFLMGSTYVDFDGQGFEASDAALKVWLLLLVDEIDRLENPAAFRSRPKRPQVAYITAKFPPG